MRDQRVWLNGVEFGSAHPKLLLQHITEAPPEVEVKTTARAGAPGQYVTGLVPSRRQITVEFAVREALDFAARAEAVSAAAAWAWGGGWLELSSRPGLRIRVEPTELPGPNRLREWTQTLRMVLTAHSWPLWEEVNPSSASGTGTSLTLQLPVGGTFETRLEAEITPQSGTLTSAEITADGQTMTLSGLSVAAGTALKIFYDERHLLHIEAGSAGLLGKRTGDDLALTPGTRHAVGVTVNTACAVTVRARGCWL